MSNGFQIVNRLAAPVALGLALILAGEARAQQPPLSVFLSFDEYGNLSLDVPELGISQSGVAGEMLSDPGPGGLPSALTYTLATNTPTVTGDVFLVEPGNDVTSDILRFNNFSDGTDFISTLVFYSDNSPDEPEEPGVLADTGFPTAFYTNTVFLDEIGPEGNNYADYHPTENQPGFFPGFDVHYHFVSDGVVPEPASLSLLGLGSLALIRRRRVHSA